MSYYRVKYYPYSETQFRHLYFYGRRRCGPLEDSERETYDYKLDESLYRTKALVRDLIRCNPWDYFVTFTFNPDKTNRYDFKECRSRLTKFFNNYRSRYSSNFRYMVIPEQHKDGAWHFHGMVRGLRDGDLYVPDFVISGSDLVPNTKSYVRWAQYNLGYFSASRVKNIEACALYVTKYVTKTLSDIGVGSRALLHSTGLHMPELLMDVDDIPCPFEAQRTTEFYKEAYLDESDSAPMLGDWWADLQGASIDDITPAVMSQIFEPVQLSFR